MYLRSIFPNNYILKNEIKDIPIVNIIKEN